MVFIRCDQVKRRYSSPIGVRFTFSNAVLTLWLTVLLSTGAHAQQRPSLLVPRPSPTQTPTNVTVGIRDCLGHFVMESSCVVKCGTGLADGVAVATFLIDSEASADGAECEFAQNFTRTVACQQLSEPCDQNWMIMVIGAAMATGLLAIFGFALACWWLRCCCYREPGVSSHFPVMGISSSSDRNLAPRLVAPLPHPRANNVVRVDDSRNYEVVVIGGGPARTEMDVGWIAELENELQSMPADVQQRLSLRQNTAQ